jgi:hypothetical protein
LQGGGNSVLDSNAEAGEKLVLPLESLIAWVLAFQNGEVNLPDLLEM